MPLRFVQPSPAVLATYVAGLLDITGTSPPDDSAIHVPVWTFDLDAVVQALGPAGETPAGCRFYAAYPPPLGTLSSEMTNPSDYGKAKFRSLLDGELAQWGWTRIQQLQTLPEVASADHELHLLSIPTLFTEAFYLRTTVAGGRNLVVPLDLFADALAPPAAQDVATYLAALQPLALARVAVVDDPLLP
jgi:hypothetical protein